MTEYTQEKGQETTKRRLDEIEKEIADLNEIRTRLKTHWQNEKNLIQSIRSMKIEIEAARNEAEKKEREGDLGKVAELRYGVIAALENKLKAATQNLMGVQKNQKMLKEEVDAEDIAEIVAKWTGIPVSRMLESERTKLLHLEERIHERLVNQVEAVRAVSDAVRRARAGLQDERKPIGSFIFLGSTGVGKTELARALAESLFNDENAMVRIDMSEYMEKFSVSRLIGAPPGYIGYEEGGQLTEAVRRKPFSVVLLDEIEKAHPEVFNLLLQVLDEGRLTDSKGRTVNFRNTIIIMTSNLGSNIIMEWTQNMTDVNRNEVMEAVRIKLFDLLKQTIRPEFLNRVDEIIMFKTLDRDDIVHIVDLQLRKVQKMVKTKNITLDITDQAKAWLAKTGYDLQFGARPLKRIIQKHVVNGLSEKILAGEIAEGDTVSIDVGKDGSVLFIPVQKKENVR